MNNRRGVFVTGTDTGVGKTYIGAAVIRALIARGISVIPRKPVESGCEFAGEELIPADAAILHAAAGRPGSLAEVCPYRFKEPLSPERAARLQGVSLTIADLERACLNCVDDDCFVWVEGAGGFYSPLASDGLNADLAARLDLRVLLVAADRLGSINHVLLTVEAIQARSLELLAIVLNQPAAGGTPEMGNAEELGKRLEYPLVSIGHLESGDAVRSQMARISELLS